MAKRSPILGYNHNVLYRGLIFHVQTEDSGLMSPHLFTHLFHSGVIISTRKLVYDAGSDEGAIKALMQAQHKAVMKELKRQIFDDKIDLYLAGTEGLLPRSAPSAPAAEAPVRASEPVILPAAAVPDLARSQNETQPIDIIELVPPIAIARTATPPPIPAIARTATPPPIPMAAKLRADTELDPRPLGTVARTHTPDRVSPPARQAPPPPPSPDELDAPTYSDGTAASISAAIAAANAHTVGQNENLRDSSPEIEIQLELDEPDDEPGRRRGRDTDIASLPDEPMMRPNSDSVQPLPPPPAGSTPYHPSQRASSVVGASLPAARPITRPPSRPHVTAPPSGQPQSISSGVVARAIDRGREESDAVEVYAPAPPSVEQPPGMMPERPGQYAQHRRSQRIPTDGKGERSGSIPIPAGLGRPGRASVMPTPAAGIPTRPPTGQQPPLTGSSAGIPLPIAPHTTEPIASRTNTAGRGTPASSLKPAVSGGVVMTRPAVIVGAPSKQTAALPRVRKAREDEGRGFGQGLISEKSLDEVILAYLSEDADDK